MNAIRSIRKNVFGATQVDFAKIAGTVQSTVCRWEAGTASPSLEEMAAIRAEAKKKNKGWNDQWFFDATAIPKAKAKARAA